MRPTEADLERALAEDEDERDLEPDWKRAELVLPRPRQSVHLRLDPEVVEFFKAGGKGHITRMQAVLRTYVDAHNAAPGDHRKTRAGCVGSAGSRLQRHQRSLTPFLLMAGAGPSNA